MSNPGLVETLDDTLTTASAALIAAAGRIKTLEAHVFALSSAINELCELTLAGQHDLAHDKLEQMAEAYYNARMMVSQNKLMKQADRRLH